MSQEDIFYMKLINNTINHARSITICMLIISGAFVTSVGSKHSLFFSDKI
jgi:hypothetical protein